jgi:hypothetical protein
MRPLNIARASRLGAMVWFFLRIVVLTLLSLLTVLLACGQDEAREVNPFGDDVMGDDVATADADDDESEAALDQGGGDESTTGEAGGCPMDESADASVSGTVYAPNFEIPVSGARIWASKTQPEGVPETVYCAECVELDCETHPSTASRADGSFELALESGTWWIAIQKGQFLRLLELDIEPGTTALSTGMTSLPDRDDPSKGEYIPRIALAWGAYDRLEDGLAKLGLGDTLIDSEKHRETLIPGTEQFAVWDNAGTDIELDVVGEFGELLEDAELLGQYHIVFVPCSNDFALGDLDAQAKTNLREWVEQGGKLYVSDWSNEFVGETFAQYQDFWQDSGKADLPDQYDSTGTVLDSNLLAWLQSLPPGLKDINSKNEEVDFPSINDLPLIETVNNWSGVETTPSVMVDDGMGGQVDVGHKVWVEGPGDGSIIGEGKWPLTISAEYGCGKLMFTTYHTAEGSDAYIGLTPQELVLLYLILEIGACQTPYQPPPVG